MRGEQCRTRPRQPFGAPRAVAHDEHVNLCGAIRGKRSRNHILRRFIVGEFVVSHRFATSMPCRILWQTPVEFSDPFGRHVSVSIRIQRIDHGAIRG
jgi:hypothetical protein